MKLSDYACQKCGHQFEQFEGTKIKCSKCQSTRVVKQLMFSGYKMKGDNSSSSTPAQAGAFKRKK